MRPWAPRLVPDIVVGSFGLDVRSLPFAVLCSQCEQRFGAVGRFDLSISPCSRGCTVGKAPSSGLPCAFRAAAVLSCAGTQAAPCWHLTSLHGAVTSQCPTAPQGSRWCWDVFAHLYCHSCPIRERSAHCPIPFGMSVGLLHKSKARCCGIPPFWRGGTGSRFCAALGWCCAVLQEVPPCSHALEPRLEITKEFLYSSLNYVDFEHRGTVLNPVLLTLRCSVAFSEHFPVPSS